MELLRWNGDLAPEDSKSFRAHRFTVPVGTRGIRVSLAYARGGDLPHNLVTVSLFDPFGFRGAGHRFAPRQEVLLDGGTATPGFIPGAIPPGDWTVELDVHCVVAPAACALTVEARDLPDHPEPPGPRALVMHGPGGPPRWLRGELHLHSTHSDGLWTTAEMAEAARGRGLDFMFLTDHNTVTGVESLRADAAGICPVHAGQELTTFHGHALALGPTHWIDWRTGRGARRIDDVARDVRAAGGVFVVAHPDAPPDPFCTGCQWTHADFDPALADAVEVWGGLWDGEEERNEGCLSLFYKWLDEGHRLAATGATDAHRRGDWQGAVPLTYVLAEDASAESLLHALRGGRTYVSSGPRVEIEARGGRAAGVGGTAMGAHTLLASYAGAPDAELRIVGSGGPRVRSRVIGEGRIHASPRPGDRWACAELWSDGVLLAVTSPVYLRS